MPLPKVSRYVKDGEVDPGVASWAERSLEISSLSSLGGLGDKPEYTYHAQLEAWFLGSCGSGVFTVAKDPITGRYNGVFPVRNDKASIVERGKENFYPQYNSVTSTRFTGTGVDMSAVAAGNEAGGTNAYWNARYAESKYTELYKGHPRLQLIVEALMFYDPVGFFGEFLSQPKNRENAYEHGLYIAEATASGVPLLGKKWIVAELVSRGETPSKAKSVADATYAGGGNYISFKRYVERFYQVKEIMVKADPLISDKQIDAIVNSPLSLDDVQKISESIAPSQGVSAGRVLTAAGAGALAAFAFGGPIGLAVGAAVLLFSGSKKSS